jgi:hypothetical protein
MWSQVLETSVGQPPDDIYGTAPPSGGPVCFVRADWLDAAVVYVAQDGASVLQPFNFQDGSWRIDYGAAHVIWQAE